MPSFDELKQKAVKAKDATVSKVQNTKDRHTSVPLKKTNWDPYSGNGPPPPPPPRLNSNSKPVPQPTFLPPPSRTNSQPSPSSSVSSGPPPIVRSTRPSLPLSSPPPVAPRVSPGLTSAPRPPARTFSSDVQMQWSALSVQDKQVFFAWLDEFFERYYNIQPPT